MTKSFKLLMCLTALLFSVDMFSQTIEVKGQVVDEVGIPIIAATVFEPDNAMGGTTTDFDGNYIIKVSSEKATLRFSCLGYTDVTEVVNGRAIINVTMVE
ncbi:MAG: carboxypeptidase-like regulatory domain-containing protein, partial [Candidatus Cryptobacteroides sp.]